MRDYFKPVEFPEEEIEPQKPAPVTVIEADITEQLKEVNKVINDLQMGTSPLRNTAIQFPKGQSPVLSSLKRLEEFPTQMKLLVQLIELADQDLGRRVALHFADIFTEVNPELKEVLK